MESIPSEQEGSHMTIGEFNANVEFGMFTPDDGDGYYATQDVFDRDFPVFPDEPYDKGDLEHVTRNFTHVVWFNK
jgi:hypothetical protein